MKMASHLNAGEVKDMSTENTPTVTISIPMLAGSIEEISDTREAILGVVDDLVSVVKTLDELDAKLERLHELMDSATHG